MAFLIDAQHDRMIRRIEVKTDGIPHLLEEQRVGREFEGPGAVRLEPEQPQIALHRTLRDPGGVRRATNGPMRADAGPALQHGRQQARDGLVIMVARTARPLLAIEPRQTSLRNRLRQWLTAGIERPTSRAISVFEVPSADASTIRARRTRPWGAARERTRELRVSRSASVSSISCFRGRPMLRLPKTRRSMPPHVKLNTLFLGRYTSLNQYYRITGTDSTQ
jgi:hypothetical protein